MLEDPLNIRSQQLTHHIITLPFPQLPNIAIPYPETTVFRPKMAAPQVDCCNNKTKTSTSISRQPDDMWQWDSTGLLTITRQSCCRSNSFDRLVEGVELDAAAYRVERLQEGVVRPWPTVGAKSPRKCHDIIVYREDQLRTTMTYRWAPTGHQFYTACIRKRIRDVHKDVSIMTKTIVEMMTRHLSRYEYVNYIKMYALWWKTNACNDDLDTFTNPLPSTSSLSNPSLWLSLRSASEHRINRVWAG